MDLTLRPAVFLDRDGTVNVEVDYLSRAEQLELIPGVAAAIARLNLAGRLVVLVTNQSGVARGMLSEERLSEIHVRLAELLAQAGARIDHIEYCPHHPTLGGQRYARTCECRKPAAGMLRAATEALGIDLGRSWIVGDSLRDLEAGKALRVRGILVRTGKGQTQLDSLAPGQPRPHVAADLGEAVEAILSQTSSG